ncbi:endonuclease/exonuclease/phosphatase family protein [Croceitalea rosinachiae]|uniref:Endonuclease/exonuclease/phosphatase family protein n=1 Tax=Croceitalea rosinachiae TaxID=3075596 RepID=A0ABU3A9X9_9FLAO|nr:endonuclease/exonuclease/phosphatase family protein [Croceitalea sp. F388]MDT0607001.1 endonuclease/exonuclease/phosphatase family protein [Croceitalea sp. F388]
MKRKLFFYRLLLGLNIVFASLLLLTLFSYFFNVSGFLSVLSLAVPLLYVINAVFLCFWLVKRKTVLLISAGLLLISHIVFGSFYKINFEDSNPKKKKELKVLSYNVWGFNKNEWIREPNIGDKITEFISKQNPDILCLQEHSRIRYQQLRQYTYRSETPKTIPKSIQAIFSKFPIIDEGSLNLPNTPNNVIFADILIGNDTIRVYNIHLQSFNIVPNTEILTEEKTTKRTYKKINETFEKQLEQAKIIRDHMNSINYRKIIMGDFNNTQFSNVYRTINNNFQDSFLEKGSALGKTYELFGFPMRIDYIFADNNFEFTSHTNFDIKLSDHYPVMATVKLKSDKGAVD